MDEQSKEFRKAARGHVAWQFIRFNGKYSHSRLNRVDNYYSDVYEMLYFLWYDNRDAYEKIAEVFTVEAYIYERRRKIDFGKIKKKTKWLQMEVDIKEGRTAKHQRRLDAAKKLNRLETDYATVKEQLDTLCGAVATWNKMLRVAEKIYQANEQEEG